MRKGFMVLMALCLVETVAAQPGLELQLGGGYVNGRGSEGPAPDLGVLQLGAALWLTDGWGLAGNFVTGPGTEEVGNGVTREDLRYYTVTLRGRKGAGPLEWNYGIGALLDGRYKETFPDGQGGRVQFTDEFNALYLETLVGLRVTPSFSIKGNVGIGIPAIDENVILQLTAVAAFHF